MKSDLLRAERIQRGWSQAKLAEALGVDTRTVRRWERGQAVPFPYYRKQLLALFEMTAEELGLSSNIDEDNVTEQALPLVIDEDNVTEQALPLVIDEDNVTEQALLSAPPDTPASTSFLLDPAIPQALDSTNSLLGRDELLMQLTERLLTGEHLAFTALHSLPGSGKSAIATALAQDSKIQAHFADGILWAGLGQHPNVLEQLTRWGNLLGIDLSQIADVKSREAWIQGLRVAIGTRRFLLVIDDAWSAEDALAFQIGGSQCSYLLTTRFSQIAFTFAEQGSILVPQLKDADGLALLARFIPQLLKHDSKRAQALVHTLNGSPLALTLMGNYLTFQSSIGQPEPLRIALADLLGTMERLHASIPNTPTESSPYLTETIPPSLHAAIAICYLRLLSEQARATLRALATLPPKPSCFSEEQALAVSQQSAKTLDELWDAGLLESRGHGCYTLHQTISDYICTLVTQEQQVDSVQVQQQEEYVSPAATLLAEENYSDVYIYQHESHSLIASLSLHLSHWKAGFQQEDLDELEELPASRPFKRLIPRSLSLLTVLVISLAVLIIISTTIIQGLIRQPSHTSTPIQANYGPPTYTLTIPTVDSSLQDTAQHLQQSFSAVYPQLVNRFALNPATVARNVTLTFSSDLSSPAAISGSTIIFNADWIRQHSGDVGLLTHELTLTLEHYPSGAPTWFGDGMADYARSVYGPADDDDWSLPDGVQPQDNYTQGGEITARFLLWLEQYTTFDIVDQLNHALQTKQPFSSTFHRLTHHTVDELWRQYKDYPSITLLPEQLYKTVTSRKPIYQSSFRVQNTHSGTYSPVLVSGLYMSDFAMQADMTIVHGAGGGFVFHFNNSNYTGMRLRVSSDGSYDLVNQVHPFTSGFSSAIKQGFNQTNRLTIIAQKHTIYLYINNQFITQVDDESSGYGQIGMLAVDWGDPADIRFEKVQVF